MRTTLTLDPDVVARLAELQRDRGWSFKEAVNQTLRRGFAAGSGAVAEYRMPVKNLGVQEGVDIDRARDLLSTLDDERDAGS